jgi:hypothetical protein
MFKQIKCTALPLMIMRLIALCIAVGSPWRSYAQELVVNGSFETYISCPAGDNQLAQAVGWTKPTDGSSDYHHSCSPIGSNQVPYNIGGYQFPRSGQGYAGIDVFSIGFPGEIFYPPLPFREYLQGTLTTTLKAGTVYAFEMYVSAGEVGQYRTSSFGVYFSKTRINKTSTMDTSRGILPFTPQIVNPVGNYPDTATWKRIAGTFTATGGEKYIIIGNFQPENTQDTLRQKTDPHFHDAYLFVDDVSLKAAAKESVEDTDFDGQVNLYPNPATDVIHVSINTMAPVRTVVTDITGRVVLDEITANHSLPVSHLDPGLYYLHVLFGDKKTVARFIKQ